MVGRQDRLDTAERNHPYVAGLLAVGIMAAGYGFLLLVAGITAGLI